jgi:hypothetical protein
MPVVGKNELVHTPYRDLQCNTILEAASVRQYGIAVMVRIAMLYCGEPKQCYTADRSRCNTGYKAPLPALLDGWELRMAFATVLLVQNTRFVLRNMMFSNIQVRSHTTVLKPQGRTTQLNHVRIAI